MNYVSKERFSRYIEPEKWSIKTISLQEALRFCARSELNTKQLTFLTDPRNQETAEIYYSGDFSLLKYPCVSVVGARDVSDDGAARARRLAKELTSFGVVVVSGLAKGVDINAHVSAMRSGGRTIAVIGTPLSKAYPAENGKIQEEIYRDHLLISPFNENGRVFKANFPKRNRVMAALSDATVIVEASDTSGSLHQAVECQRLGRWLFIAKSVVENKALTWPQKFLDWEKTRVLSSTEEVFDAIRSA